jgi:hypothetical protein
VSIRKNGDFYELYRKYFKYGVGVEREETIFRSKNLNEVVDFSNKTFKMNDVVENEV